MEEIRLERREGYAVLTIDRPAKRNILTEKAIAELKAAFDDLEKDSAIRCVLLRGAGEEAFSAGYDLTSLSATGAGESDELHVLLDRVERYPYPIVALLRGFAVGGGCELALACDVRVAGDDVRMGMPPARLGIVYPLAGYERFLRTVGLAATKEIFFSARTFGADDCRRLGLVSVVKPADEAESAALALAEEIGGHAPLSLRGTKQILRHSTTGALFEPTPREELAKLFSRSLSTEDSAEGKRALIERRKPRFQGR